MFGVDIRGKLEAYRAVKLRRLPRDARMHDFWIEEFDFGLGDQLWPEEPWTIAPLLYVNIGLFDEDEEAGEEQ